MVYLVQRLGGHIRHSTIDQMREVWQISVLSFANRSRLSWYRYSIQGYQVCDKCFTDLASGVVQIGFQ